MNERPFLAWIAAYPYKRNVWRPPRTPGSRSFTATSSFPLALPSTIELDRTRGASSWLPGVPCFWGHFRLRRSCFQQHWLVCSWSPNRDPQHHRSLVLSAEAPDSFTLDWFASDGEIKARFRNERCTFLRATLKASSARALFDLVGDPRQEGTWLTRRLLPSLIPAAVRTFPDPALQLWFSL